MPSSMLPSASPMMAKSWKSVCACAMNCWRSAPATGRQRTLTNRSGPVAEALQHRVEIERVGHQPTVSIDRVSIDRVSTDCVSTDWASVDRRRRRRLTFIASSPSSAGWIGFVHRQYRTVMRRIRMHDGEEREEITLTVSSAVTPAMLTKRGPRQTW